ncbi:hypothetical protein BC828DRAFT_380982 [Blastocladiella britannica]|nr:hypothetical protein BC828DRAFT_380982 [Blastocladiella britannica]
MTTSGIGSTASTGTGTAGHGNLNGSVRNNPRKRSLAAAGLADALGTTTAPASTSTTTNNNASSLSSSASLFAPFGVPLPFSDQLHQYQLADFLNLDGLFAAAPTAQLAPPFSAMAMSAPPSIPPPPPSLLTALHHVHHQPHQQFQQQQFQQHPMQLHHLHPANPSRLLLDLTTTSSPPSSSSSSSSPAPPPMLLNFSTTSNDAPLSLADSAALFAAAAAAPAPQSALDPFAPLSRPRKTAKLHAGHMHAAAGWGHQQHYHDDHCAAIPGHLGGGALLGFSFSGAAGFQGLPATTGAGAAVVAAAVPVSAAAVPEAVTASDPFLYSPTHASSVVTTPGLAVADMHLVAAAASEHAGCSSGSCAATPASASVPGTAGPTSLATSPSVAGGAMMLPHPHLVAEDECSHLECHTDDPAAATAAANGIAPTATPTTKSTTGTPALAESPRLGPRSDLSTVTTEELVKLPGRTGASVTAATVTPPASSDRRIGQRGKPPIVGIEQKHPGQFIHGSGDNLFIDARREDGTVTCISLRTSPHRCKADLIEALNWVPASVLTGNWRYFSIMLAKIDQSKPFKRLASAHLAATARTLREMNPAVNKPPPGLDRASPLVQMHTLDLAASPPPATAVVADPGPAVTTTSALPMPMSSSTVDPSQRSPPHVQTSTAASSPMAHHHQHMRSNSSSTQQSSNNDSAHVAPVIAIRLAAAASTAPSLLATTSLAHPASLVATLPPQHPPPPLSPPPIAARQGPPPPEWALVLLAAVQRQAVAIDELARSNRELTAQVAAMQRGLVLGGDAAPPPLPLPPSSK